MRENIRFLVFWLRNTFNGAWCDDICLQSQYFGEGLRQEDHKFKASLATQGDSVQKLKIKNKTTNQTIKQNKCFELPKI
jgi:hypothetical protein